MQSDACTPGFGKRQTPIHHALTLSLSLSHSHTAAPAKAWEPAVLCVPDGSQAATEAKAAAEAEFAAVRAPADKAAVEAAGVSRPVDS
jgi:hypothetical protein